MEIHWTTFIKNENKNMTTRNEYLYRDGRKTKTNTTLSQFLSHKRKPDYRQNSVQMFDKRQIRNLPRQPPSFQYINRPTWGYNSIGCT